MTGLERQPRSVVDAVTDTAIAALLPADRRLSMTAAEHRDRAHVDAALDRLLPSSVWSEAERSRVRRAAPDRLAVSRARRVAAARERGLDAARTWAVVPVTAEREAWFQGSLVNLQLNAEAAVQLRDALDRIARLEPTAAATTQLELQLPDGRPLRLAVRLTDAGSNRDPHGVYVSSDGIAYADVSGDFAAHVAARRAIDAATRPYLDVPRSGQVAAALDTARVDQALDGRVPAPESLAGAARDAVRTRALQAASRSRGRRITDAVRLQRDLGIDQGL